MSAEQKMAKIQSLVGEAYTLSEELEVQHHDNEATALLGFMAMAHGGVLSCDAVFMRAAVRACKPLMQAFVDSVGLEEEAPN